jgi:hypothetical protein
MISREGNKITRTDFEDHFYTRDYIKAMYRNRGYPRFNDEIQSKGRRPCYYSENRPTVCRYAFGSPPGPRRETDLKVDECGVDVEVLSLSTPGIE